MKAYPSVPLKKAKHILIIPRDSFSSATSLVNSEDYHVSALDNMFQLYSLARDSVNVATYDVLVSAKEAIKILPVSPLLGLEGKRRGGIGIRRWKHVTANLDLVGRGTAVILLLHGCDGMTTDIWSWWRLKDHYQSLSIYLIIKESDKNSSGPHRCRAERTYRLSLERGYGWLQLRQVLPGGCC